MKLRGRSWSAPWSSRPRSLSRPRPRRASTSARARRTPTAATRSRSGTATCWSGRSLPRTTDTSVCATLGRTAFLPSGILLFGVRHDDLLARTMIVWASDGTTDGTVKLGEYGGDECYGAWRIVGRSAYISDHCDYTHGGTSIVATRGTPASTWTLAVLGAVSGRAAVRRAPWPHLLRRHGQGEGPRAVGEQRHPRGHPRRQGHPAGRTRLVSPAASRRTAAVSASPRTTAPGGDGG